VASPEIIPEDETGFECLRPDNFVDFCGQNELKTQLEIFISAANQRQEALDHVLLSGPPGLGKTTFARIISGQLKANFSVTSGPAIERQGDLAAILTNLSPRDVLFIDEIHRLRQPVEEVLYSAMEDFKLDIIVGKGPEARSLRLDLPPFTLIGATTKSGMLSAPLRDRFGILGHFEYYPAEILAQILIRSARLLEVKLEPEAAGEIARRSRGTPRIANRLLRRVRDFSQVVKNSEDATAINLETARNALFMLEVDEKGLNNLDLKILRVLEELHEGGAIGLSTLAISVGEEEETIAEVCEPFLIQTGFLERTPRGRRITNGGRKYYTEWKKTPRGSRFSQIWGQAAR
jgi:Holliday junction DNA helicase RuvB